MNQPRSVSAATAFPHKEAIARALERGVRCRKDPRTLLAGQLVGTYELRARLAQDPELTAGFMDAEASAKELSTVAENLKIDPTTKIAIYYIGPTDENIKYLLFEEDESGKYIGCVSGNRQHGG